MPDELPPDDAAAREVVLGMDPRLVEEAAMAAGRETWTGWPWSLRLRAIREHEEKVKASAHPPSVAPSTPKPSPSVTPKPAPSSAHPTPNAHPHDTPALPSPSEVSLPKPSPPQPPQAHPKPPTPPQPSLPTPPQPSADLPRTPSVVSGASGKSMSVTSLPPQEERPLSHHTTPRPTPPRQDLTPLLAPRSEAAPAVDMVLSAGKSPSVVSLVASQRTEAPAASPAGPCPHCHDKAGKIKKLQGQLEKAEADAKRWKRQADAMEEELTQTRGKVQTSEQQSRYIDQLERKVHDLTSQLEQYGAGGDLDFDDVNIMSSQIWTLETALGLRNKEIERLKGILEDFAHQVEVLDRKLAEALRKVMQQSQHQADQDEAQALGGKTVDEAVTEVKKKRKSRRRASAGAAVSAAELESLRSMLRAAAEEKDILQKRLRGSVDGTVLEQMRNAMGKMEEALQEREAMILALQEQLDKAQDALIAGAETGADLRHEAEVKLRETRGVLATLLHTSTSRPPARQPTPQPHVIPPQSYSGYTQPALRPPATPALSASSRVWCTPNPQSQSRWVSPPRHRIGL